ncbi:MAG: helix-turn-helix domain-containing protein [bacterium]
MTDVRSNSHATVPFPNIRHTDGADAGDTDLASVDAAGCALGDRIRRARLEAGLTQSQLAGTEISPRTISRIEGGHVRPSRRVLAYIARRVGRPAVHFFEDAAPDPSEIDYVLAQARLRQAANDLDGADRHYAAAVDLALAAGDVSRAASVRAEQVGHRLRRGWTPEREAALVEAQAEARRFGQAESIARGYIDLGFALASSGREDRACEAFEAACGTLGDTCPDLRRLCLAMLTRLAAARGGDLTELQRLLSEVARARDPRHRAAAYESVADTAYAAGHIREAMDAALHALLIRKSMSAKAEEAAARYQVARQMRQQGLVAEAVAEFLRVRALARDAGDYMTEAQSLVAVGETYSAAGRIAEAADVLEEARHVFARAAQGAGSSVAQINSVAPTNGVAAQPDTARPAGLMPGASPTQAAG